MSFHAFFDPVPQAVDYRFAGTVALIVILLGAGLDPPALRCPGGQD